MIYLDLQQFHIDNYYPFNILTILVNFYIHCCQCHCANSLIVMPL